MIRRPRFTWLAAWAVFLGAAYFLPALQAGWEFADREVLLAKAREFELRGQWSDAGRLYDEIVKKDHDDAEAKDGFQRCLRHFQLARRHRDPAFRQVLLSLKPTQAADVYEEVIAKVQTNFVDGIDLARLFELGLQELSFALEDGVFIKEHLAHVGREPIEGFRSRLDQWREKKPQSAREARDRVLDVALSARGALGLAPAVVILEFACGACNGLDEYSAYLSPGQLLDAQAAAKGELVGPGIQVVVINQKLYIAYVYPESSAAERRLRPGDRIIQIDHQPVDSLSAEVASARLQGEAGSIVELEVLPLGEAVSRIVKLQRRPLPIRSVESEMIFEDNLRIGLLRVLIFHDNTIPDMRDALVQLQSMGLDVLILDLRGNPGGQFRPAIQATEMFLSEGVIVLTHSRLNRGSRTYKANNPHAVDVPLVVLVDGDTASSAEMVAGALKENHRATLVGQPTFGKGTLQLVLPLEKVSSGIRITIARLFSPSNSPYSGHGVVPHTIVTDGPDAQLSAARQIAVELGRMMGR